MELSEPQRVSPLLDGFVLGGDFVYRKFYRLHGTFVVVDGVYLVGRGRVRDGRDYDL
jgi:hypothetical protein